jgi:DNA-binding NarL/FixJ family response regulator
LTAELQPDVLVCDLVMPGLDGIALAEEVIRAAPRTRVLIVSNYIEQPYIHEAFKKGVAGYMDKVDCSTFLPEAVRTVVEGEKYLSPSLAWQSGPPGPSSMN